MPAPVNDHAMPQVHPRRAVPFQPFPQGHRSEHPQVIQRVEHDH